MYNPPTRGNVMKSDHGNDEGQYNDEGKCNDEGQCSDEG